MANLAITSHCNLACRYCFTQDVFRKTSAHAGHMSLTVFQRSLDLLVRSGVNEVRLLGGEPTLHPEFITLLNLALKTGKFVRVFTNGMIPDSVLDALCRIPEKQLTLVLNINHLKGEKFDFPEKISAVLERLHEKIIPGLNIDTKNVELLPLLALVKNHRLKKAVRLGLAQPCTGYDNAYLPPKHYFAVGDKVLGFTEQAQRQSVKVILDCGFVPCMFADADWKNFDLDFRPGRQCEPIPDILPDGTVVPCYPLSGFISQALDETQSTSQSRESFMTSLAVYRTAGIYKICSICDYRKKGLCTGGCTAHKIKRFNRIEKKRK